MRTDKTSFAGQEIEVVSAGESSLIKVLEWLKQPEDFHGDVRVDYLIKFGRVFEGLIGKYQGQYGDWDKDKLVDKGIVVLEHHDNEARKIMNQINDLAQEVMADGKKYDDQGFCREYFQLTKSGYERLKKYEGRFGFNNEGVPVSLERAGLVTTRLALGIGMNEKIEDEVRVVTKRTHLKDEPATYLSVTVKWRDKEKIKKLANQIVLLSDFVNPASGASGAGMMVALQINKVKPKLVKHRSISLTQQGTMFIRKVFDEMGIATQFYSLGECDQLNQAYYLVGNRAVGDAGHLLRHFLPKWYKQ